LTFVLQYQTIRPLFKALGVNQDSSREKVLTNFITLMMDFGTKFPRVENFVSHDYPVLSQSLWSEDCGPRPLFANEIFIRKRGCQETISSVKMTKSEILS
jgi:hypothetical protein